MPLNRLPHVDQCCGCVTDLKTAAAIIAVFGIITSPAVSWAVVRHTYVLRVSCFISSSDSKPDVYDINLNNVISFGFGPNAGLGPSCLSVNKTEGSTVTFRSIATESGSSIGDVVKAIGWIVLISDVIFMICSINFLVRIFKGPEKHAASIFIIAAIVTMLLSFVYSLMYVSVCICKGGTFPVFEFVFAFVDLIIWVYFIIVVNSYRRKNIANPTLQN